MHYTNDLSTSFADTYCLDLFVDDCYENETQHQLYRSHKASSNLSNSIHLRNFLMQNNFDSFDVFTESVCLSNGSTNSESSANFKRTLTLFLICSVLFTVIAMILRLTFPTQTDSVNSAGSIFIGIMAIAAFSFFLGSEILARKRCTQKITGVCVAIHKKMSDGDLLYKPVYYVKYNDIGYLLMGNSYSNIGVPDIGDIEHDIYINPSNPLDHVRTKSMGNYLFLILICGLFMFFSIKLLVS